MSAEKKSPAPLIIIILLIVAGLGGYLAYSGKLAPKSDVPVSEQPGEPAYSAQADSPEKEAVLLPFPPETNLVDALPTDAALKKRVMGDENAPITMFEYSSLTCPHCANYHQTTFKEVKRDYIETGKLKVVFDDFPLNGAAMHATMVSRCIPEQHYFDYVQFLFETQEKWAFDPNYIAYLKQTSQLAGLSPEGFDSCINNEELRQGLTDNIKESQEKSGLDSTPTFIFSNGKKIAGSRSYEEFKAVIDAEAAPAGDEAPAVPDATGGEAVAEQTPAEEPAAVEAAPAEEVPAENAQ